MFFFMCVIELLLLLAVANAAPLSDVTTDPVTGPGVLTEDEELRLRSVCASFGLIKEGTATCSRLAEAASANQWEQVQGLAHQLLKPYPKNGAGYFWLGYASLKQRKHIVGVRHFQASVDLSPEVSLAHLSLGLSYLTIQQYKLFEDELHWVIASRPEEPLPYYYLGRYYSSDLGQTDKGEEFFQLALARNPSDYRSRYHLGHLYELKGDWERAKSEYRKAAASVVSQKTVYGWPWQGLARAYLHEENLSESLRCAQEAATMDPKLAGSRFLLGKLYVQMGDLTKGVEELRAAAELDPADAAPHYWLARTYLKMKMPAEARKEQEIFAQLKSVYPND